MNLLKARSLSSLYARDLVTYVMHSHGLYEWRHSFEIHHFAGCTEEHFSRYVGRVVVALAKGTEKETLSETGPDLITMIRSYHILEIFFRFFANSYVDRLGGSHTSLLKLFAYITEFAVLYHLRVPEMSYAPEVAVRAITDILLKANEGSFVPNGGLRNLNRTARRMMRDPESNYEEHFNSGHFAW